MNKKNSSPKKRKPRRDRKKRPSARGPFLVRHPLNGVDLDVRRKFAAQLVASATDRFEQHMKRLVQLSAELSSLHVLAILAHYSLMASSKDVAERASKGLRQTEQVQQGHVEFMQALLLRQAWAQHDPPSPPQMGEVFETLPALFEAYSSMRIPAATTSTGDEDRDAELNAVASVQAFLRGHTAVVRNWGYFSTVKRIASEVLGAVDTDFEVAYGLTLTKVIAIFEHLIRSLEGRMSEHWRRMHTVFHAGTPAEIARELGVQFGDVGNIEFLQNAIRAPGMQIRDATGHVLMGLEAILPTYFFVDVAMLVADLSLDMTATLSLLKQLSLPFGALQDRSPDSLLLDNPVWTKPLVEVAEGVFFCSTPQTLMSFVFPIVEGLIQPHQPLREKLQRTRAKYLEDATEKLLRLAFPGCSVARSYKWVEDGDQYECDLALRYDATILLVESKSGGVSWPALRGAPQRMLKHIQELIVSPSDQSARLAERLKAAIAGEPGPVADFPLPLNDVHAVSRLSVTLHDFATIQSVPSMLLSAGLIKSEHRLAPCMTLADLEVVVDVLDTPYLRMHYLRRRAELLTTAMTFGDELDTLGMYLDTGFNLGEAETGGAHLSMVGYSARLDRYYVSRDEGIAAKKPRVNVTPWMRSLCDQLLDRSSIGWYELAHALLSLGHAEQLSIERDVRSLVRRMKSGRPAKDGLNTIIFIPYAHRRLAVAFVVQGLGEANPARDVRSHIAGKAFETPYIDGCAVFTFRAVSEDLSYRSAGMLYRTDRAVEARTFL